MNRTAHNKPKQMNEKKSPEGMSRRDCLKTVGGAMLVSTGAAAAAGVGIDPAIYELNYAASARGNAGVVGRKKKGDVACFVEVFHKVEKGQGCVGIEVGGWFIGKDKGGV